MAVGTDKTDDQIERAAQIEELPGAGSPRELRYTYTPAHYFLLTYALTWIPWMAAVYFSYRAGMTAYNYVFFFLGGFGPFVSALVLIWRSKNQSLKRDFLDRLVNLHRFSLPYLAITLLLAPCISCVSVAISEYFGGPASQLTFVAPLFMPADRS